jgi:hypothetical protein
MQTFFIRKLKLLVLTLLLSFVLGMVPASPEEGMFPLSEIHKVDLVKAGLKINQAEIYNPNGISLIDALVNLSGCTGSFISEKGLIITNHHCAFSAIANSSTVEKNYLENGFHASSMGEEIPAPGYTCRITESYQDVSDVILSTVADVQDPAQRVQKISAKMRELAEAATNEKESITAEVSEMFAGKSYILFKYRIIRDVRLVYAPPQSIGNFGGETDNWVWPRHTGDFSLMRAYVSVDGKAVPYSKENIPFKPKKFLEINPAGVEENDFVFILGYPGRTFRHRPSQFIKYQQDYLLPFISNIYGYAIETMNKISQGNQKLKLEFAPRIKGLANTMKNYQGKLRGLKRIDLVQAKVKEENELQNFINANPELKNKYGALLSKIGEVYKNINDLAYSDLWIRQMMNMSPSIAVANYILNYTEEMQKPESDRLPAFQKNNIERTKSMLTRSISSFNPEFEEILFKKMVDEANGFPENSRIKAVDDIFGSNGDFDESLVLEFTNELKKLKLTDKNNLEVYLTKSPDEIRAMKSNVFAFAQKFNTQQKVVNNENERSEGTLNKLYGDLVDVKILWKNQNFIPDANSTLRLTYGYIKGYNPVDALYGEPFTSIGGIIEKNSIYPENEEFGIPDKLRTLYNQKEFGKYTSKKSGKLPIAMLYNMDTTGGNSGSPILDAYGRLIGVNFDRAFEATINDFAWSESYSRSIGVDVRYVLWVIDKFSGAKNILDELKL